MIKQIQVVERRLGITRRKISNQMFCDKCGLKIVWCVPHPMGQFCEKCLKEVKQKQSDADC